MSPCRTSSASRRRSWRTAPGARRSRRPRPPASRAGRGRPTPRRRSGPGSVPAPARWWRTAPARHSPAPTAPAGPRAPPLHGSSRVAAPLRDQCASSSGSTRRWRSALSSTETAWLSGRQRQQSSRVCAQVTVERASCRPGGSARPSRGHASRPRRSSRGARPRRTPRARGAQRPSRTAQHARSRTARLIGLVRQPVDAVRATTHVVAPRPCPQAAARSRRTPRGRAPPTGPRRPSSAIAAKGPSAKGFAIPSLRPLRSVHRARAVQRSTAIPGQPPCDIGALSVTALRTSCRFGTAGRAVRRR